MIRLSKLFPESPTVHRYLDGLSGLEIGGSAHNAFGVDTLNVDFTDDLNTVYKRAEVQLCGEAMTVEIMAPGDAIPLPDKSVDFVLSSHVIEHIWDPIGAIQEWRRLARKYVIVVCPQRHALGSDADKPLSDYHELHQRHVGEIPPPAKDTHEHYSRWTARTFLQMCERNGFRVLEAVDPDDKVGNGFLFVLDASDGEGESVTFLLYSKQELPTKPSEDPTQHWTVTEGPGITRFNCLPWAPYCPDSMIPEKVGQLFGLAYLVPFQAGLGLELRLRVTIPEGMTCRFEISGFTTRYQRAFAVVDASGKCVDIGDELLACEVDREPTGSFELRVRFRSPLTTSEWVYVFFNAAGTAISWPRVLGLALHSLDANPNHRLFESAVEVGESTWFAVQAAFFFRNYFHFEFELHRPGAELVSLALIPPVEVTGVRWTTGAAVAHDGQGLTPERTSYPLRAPALMEQFGPQMASAGHCVHGLLAEFTDLQYLGSSQTDELRNFRIRARFSDATEMELPLCPDHLPSWPARWEQIMKHLKPMGGGRFLEVGGRGENSEAVRAKLGPEWEYVALDIHPGPNVDLVGDAHRLSELLPPRSVKVVYSFSAMEHFLAPWRFVVEANRVMCMGGLFIAGVPVSWPLHAEPWDFWRMSDHAWPALLNANTGFELLETGVYGRSSILPFLPAHKGRIRAQYDPAYETTFAIARKIGESTAQREAYDVNWMADRYEREIPL